MKYAIAILIPALLAGASRADLEKARNAQDRAGLDKIGHAAAAEAAQKPKNVAALYDSALVQSYIAEVALEMRDKNHARSAAEAGIAVAQSAVALEPKKAELHRVLGTLCGLVIPANVIAGLKYGKCAQEEIQKALELDPKTALNWVSSGVGKYYLPASFGGGADLALKDFEKAIALDSKLAEAYMWSGLALRKSNHNPDAHKAFEKALELNPTRVWIKQQLEKTPAK